MYLELMCHFHICLVSHNIRGNMCRLKSWADYLFPTLESVPEEIHTLVADVDIKGMMTVSGHGDIVLEEDNVIYERGGSFKSFHHQARQALLAGFFSV